MLPKILLTLIHLVFICLLIVSAWIIYDFSNRYEQETQAFTEQLHALPKIKTELKKLGELITGGLYDGYSKELESLKNIRESQELSQSRIQLWTIVFMISCVVYLVLTLKFDRSFFPLSALIVSIIALLVGLLAPILSIVTYKDFPVIGKVVFMFHSKGIITTIQSLFSSGDIIVAIALLIFSVLIPLFKSLIMGLVALGINQSLVNKSLWLIKEIGKWSMADVFVVALLLTYFSMNKDDVSQAEIQVGLYFFLAYVVLSMIVSRHLTTSYNSK